jgi:hypothetical protein
MSQPALAFKSCAIRAITAETDLAYATPPVMIDHAKDNAVSLVRDAGCQVLSVGV